MRVEREAAQKQQEPAKCMHGGAMVGDTIIFSSHNPMNRSLRYVLANKLYKVIGMTPDGAGKYLGVIIDDEGEDHYLGNGSYDIIIKAEQKHVEAPFRPVHVVLESEEEVKEMRRFLYRSDCGFIDRVYDALDVL